MNVRRFPECLILVLLAAVTGCAGRPGADPDYIPAYTPIPMAKQMVDGGIYEKGFDIALFEDVKARRIGDLVTVLLVEQTSGQNSSDSDLAKAASANIAAPLIGGRTRPNAAVDLSGSRTFNGEASSSQSNRLSGSITVTVSEILPGGNLVVQGEKWIEINNGREYIRLRGVVRPRDIAPDNTVFSTEVADARISYRGTGSQADANQPGWLSRILFSDLWPL